ncbi:hypothetical protein GS399_18540 [Pedobacter sp. HMF7647]|uniref:Uncharacterized protein n=1 Tax=Hufsiella arboris TaxID=2695275 RepID=A0A7K1YEE0_9SPHI|nr:hypothetical protein [Hufsiella arboris]MXV52974.1 hypothetical protein [Hufsiella arboris]
MKKLLFLLIVPALMVLSSCQKTEYVNPNQTILTDIVPDAWRSTDGGRTYTTLISMPEIDSYFNDYGAVLVYLSFDGTTYEQIPQVYQGVAYSYNHVPGSIQLILQTSDNNSTVIKPGGVITAKIVLIQSQQ